MEIIYATPSPEIVAEEAKEDLWKRLVQEAEAEARKASTKQPVQEQHE